jgi:hypothetical protein
MNKHRRAGLLLSLLCAGVPAVLLGQYPGPAPTSGLSYQVPRGFWISAGPGYAQADCGNGCRVGAPSGNLEAGWAAGPKLLLSLAALGWTKGDEQIRITNGSLGLRARYYPVPLIGFFFTGGAGLGMIRLSAGPQGSGDPFTTTGYAILGGVGCDFRVARELSVTPFANWSGIRTHAGPNHLRADLWQGGIAITLH